MTEKQMPTFRYAVVYLNGSTDATAYVKASYLQEEGSLVLFKDAFHSVVFAVNAHALIVAQCEGVVRTDADRDDYDDREQPRYDRDER